MAMERGLGRSPTFLVGSERQRFNLENMQRREQHLAEQYQKNKPLCFSAGQYQLTHPLKAMNGHIDADVTMVNPMMVGVMDGVSQIAEYGLDPSELPKELMKACEELAVAQLIPERGAAPEDSRYQGPIPLMREAFEATEAMGSTTALLAIMDNSTMIHGKLHPMIAVLSIGDCEILVLRRGQSREQGLEVVFHTEMQRIEGNAQCPLQICRIDDRVDPDFDERMPIEVIERGSAVHCVSAYEGDVVVLGSDGVFDNLFLDEIVDICNEFFPVNHGKFRATEPALLEEVARRVVEACHAKTLPGPGHLYPDTPIGKGGKRDDTCCVVGEVTEWTDTQSALWNRIRRQRRLQNMLTCGGGLAGFLSCSAVCTNDQDDDSCAGTAREYSYSEYAGSDVGEEDDESRCCIA
jgi:serine/threonine protein phosphatase PrpC